MSQAAQYVKTESDEVRVTVSPPQEVAQVLMTRHTWQLPPLAGITEMPVLRPDGSVLTTPGYDATTALLYMPARDLNVPPVPERPTRHQLQEARDFLLENVLVDFPFVDDGKEKGTSASRANALALLLTPVIRPLLNNLAPLAILDKPQQGTGAGLYAEIVSIIATGHPASMGTAPHTEDEWRKRITSVLTAGHNVVIIDNVEGPLMSPSLCAVLTARVWSDRRLQQTAMVTLPHETTWMVTGNNIELRGDLPRRVYWIRLNAHTARPWQRKGFKHDELLDWVTEHRGDILAHLLTMAHAWVVADTPSTSVSALGNFTPWARTLGGILAQAEVPGFLENLSALYDQLDETTTQWSRFLHAWHDCYGVQPQLLSEVVANLRHDQDPHRVLRECLPEEFVEDLATKTDRRASRLQRRLGNAFKKLVDRYFPDDLHIEKAGEVHRATKWCVLKGQEGTPDNVLERDSPDSPQRHNL
jgi:hypothetical protein